ncbi:MAG: hypothetical protein HC835_01010 [Oscillatoriales cyanobacterium RM2_1_1]|nr:hypothetical protein [Oscillatoriales cyanobacterium SM2_3_0]NJO44318.1 hypothetical protein [Oscillatoriales cyanobacterium RM2_1_1]
MIISDLNYLEVAQEPVVGGVFVAKFVDISVDVDQDFNVNIDVDVNKDIDATLDSNVDISGNFASLTFDVTAIGNNSFAEGDVSVIVTGDLSEVSGTLIAGVQ